MLRTYAASTAVGLLRVVLRNELIGTTSPEVAVMIELQSRIYKLHARHVEGGEVLRTAWRDVTAEL
jgi:hypothetical protein